MARELPQARAVGRRPEADVRVLAAGRDDFPVGRYRHAEDVALVPGELGPHGRLGDVPDLGLPVHASRDQGLAVGRERDGEDVAHVSVGIDPCGAGSIVGAN